MIRQSQKVCRADTDVHAGRCRAQRYTFAIFGERPHDDLPLLAQLYDANALRHKIQERGAFANIPPKANRKWKTCFSPFLCRNRNAIERMFCRLKDFWRVATYDRNAANFLATVCIAAIVSYWL